MLVQNPALLEVVRTDSAGIVIASVYRENSVLASLITIPQSQWFLQARAGKTYIGNIQLSANNQPYLIMAVPSLQGGVVAARVEMNVLGEVVENIHSGSSGQAYVISRDGQVIAHTRAEMVLRNTSLQGRPEFAALIAAPNNEWSGTFTNFEGQYVVGNTKPIEGTNWLVFTEVLWSEAFEDTRNAILFLSGVVLLLMGVTSWVVANASVIKVSSLMRSSSERTI